MDARLRLKRRWHAATRVWPRWLEARSVRSFWILLLYLLSPSCTPASPSVPEPAPPPSFSLSLHDCQEMHRSTSDGRVCEVAAGKEVSVLVEPGAGGSGKVTGLLTLQGPDGVPRRVDGPFQLQAAHVWRGALKGEEGWRGERSRLEVLAWTGPAPELPSSGDAGLAAALEPLATRSDVRRVWIDFTWQRPPIEAFPQGSEARRCWEAYDARRHDDDSIALCRTAWEGGGALEPTARMRLGTRLALMYRLRGDYPEAERVLETITAQAVQAGALSRARTALYNLADVRLNAGALRRATEALDQALTLTRDAEDLAGEAAVLRKSGQVLQRLGDYTRAETQLRAAAGLADRLGLIATGAHTRYDLAVLFVQLGDMESALRELEAAAPYFRSLETGEGASRPGNWEDLGKFFGTLGWVRAAALRRGLRADSAAAIQAECYDRAIQYFERLSPGSHEARKHALFAVDLHLDQGDVPAARTRLDRIQTDADSSRLPPEFFLSRGELRLAQGAFAGALKDFEQVGGLEMADPDLPWRAAFGQARARVGLGQREKGARALERAMTLVEEQARSVVPGLDRGWFIGDREEIYRFAEQVRLQAGDVAGAFAMAERSRVLADQSRTTRARVAWLLTRDPEGLRARQARIEGLYQALRPDDAEVTLLPAERRKRHREREVLRPELRAAESELADWIERSAPRSAAPAVDPAAVRGLLSPGEVVVAFSATPQGLIAYRIDPAGIQVRRLHLSLSGAQALVERGRRALLKGAVADAAMQSLGNVLLEAAGPLPARRLIFLPYGPFHRFPFHALPAAAGEVLNARLEVNVTSSASQLVAQRRSRAVGGRAGAGSDPTRAGPGPALVVGDTTRDLSSTRIEATTVAGLVPGSTLLLGEAAERQAVLRGLPEAQVFHFAGHGVMDGNSVQGPHLLLAAGDRLTALDLFARPLRAALVVLSGCETGGGTLMGGGDFQGLTAGFLGAGAGAVLATHWRLEQGDALPLMRSFYRRWSGEGLGAGEALRRTLEEARAGVYGPVQAHPRVWTAFTIWGDGRVVSTGGGKISSEAVRSEKTFQ